MSKEDLRCVLHVSSQFVVAVTWLAVLIVVWFRICDNYGHDCLLEWIVFGIMFLITVIGGGTSGPRSPYREI